MEGKFKARADCISFRNFPNHPEFELWVNYGKLTKANLLRGPFGQLLARNSFPYAPGSIFLIPKQPSSGLSSNLNLLVAIGKGCRANGI